MSAALRFTSADLLKFRRDGKRREIIAEELYVSASPHWYHQLLCGNFVFMLNGWEKLEHLGIAVVAPGLIFAEDDDLVPDVVWVSHERLEAILVRGKLRGAPELVIEVLSPGKRNAARDRDAKQKLYSRRGVDEYWIAEWPLHRVEVNRRVGDRLVLVAALGPSDTLTSPLLPGFALPIDELFAGIPFGAADEEDEG